MTLSTLQRGLKRELTEPSDIQRDGKRLVRVKVIGGSGTADREGLCAMAVVLAKGRRVELRRELYPARARARGTGPGGILIRILDFGREHVFQGLLGPSQFPWVCLPLSNDTC